MTDSILSILKTNFDGDFWAALEAFKNVASPTSLALIEWALEHPKPDKVFVIEHQDYDAQWIEEIHATEAPAQQRLTELRKESKYYDIEEYEVKHG